MPVHSWSLNLFPDRIDIAGHLNAGEISSLVANSRLKVLQFYQRVDEGTLHLLNHHFFPKRPDVQLRAYGFGGAVCDLGFTARMGNVRHFSADCLMDAAGFENIAGMENLESLGIGVYHLKDFRFLEEVTPHLKKLFLGQTSSKRPSLGQLRRFASLKELYVEGHDKGIEVLSGLDSLERLVLRSISTSGLEYLRPLQHLWSLELKLGGIADLRALAGLANIKYLELWQIRGLSEISVVSSLKGLQCLILQSLPQIVALPDLTGLYRLRRISLVNMKGLKDLRPLEFAPALEDFHHGDARGMEPENYIPLLQNRSLRRALVGFGSNRKEKRFNELRAEHGKAGIEAWSDFQFD